MLTQQPTPAGLDPSLPSTALAECAGTISQDQKPTRSDDSNAPVAQWTEQRFPKPQAAGSNPAGGTQCPMRRARKADLTIECRFTSAVPSTSSSRWPISSSANNKMGRHRGLSLGYRCRRCLHRLESTTAESFITCRPAICIPSVARFLTITRLLRTPHLRRTIAKVHPTKTLYNKLLRPGNAPRKARGIQLGLNSEQEV